MGAEKPTDGVVAVDQERQGDGLVQAYGNRDSSGRNQPHRATGFGDGVDMRAKTEREKSKYDIQTQEPKR